MNVLKTWFDKEVYNKEIEIYFRDCDKNRILKLPALMGYASDIAGDDYADRGISHYDLMEAKQILVLVRYHYRFFRIPSVREMVTFKTWEKGIESGYVIRDYEMLDSNNEVCILISSTWVIVNPETRKIVRPKNFVFREILSSDRKIDCEACGKISFDEEKLIYLGEKTALYSDIDANNHMNNANYGNVAIDFLPSNLRERNFSDYYINYIKELKLGEEIKIYGYQEANAYYMIGKFENNLCFTCKFVFEDM